MRIIFVSVLIPFTQNYQNQSMLVETIACQICLVFLRQCMLPPPKLQVRPTALKATDIVVVFHVFPVFCA